MGFGGILAGAMGGAAEGLSQSAEQQMKTNQLVDIEKQVSDIRAQKELMIDQAKRDRDMVDIGRKATATAAAAPILAKGEADALNAMMSDPNYVQNLSTKSLAEHAAQIKSSEIAAGASKYAADQHLAGTKYSVDAQTTLHQPDADTKKFQLEKAKTISGMRETLSALPPGPERDAQEQKIKDLEGTGTKSYADVVSAAGVLQRAAANKFKEADDMTASLTPEERKQLRVEGNALQANSVAMINSVSEKRGINTGKGGTDQQVDPNNPALKYQQPTKPAAAPAAAPADPYEDAAPQKSAKAPGIIQSAQPSLTAQLTEKIKNSSNDPQAFSVLAYEANTALPKVMEQINSMQQSLENLPANASSERGALQRRMDDLVRARQIDEGVIAQAKARDISAVRKPR